MEVTQKMPYAIFVVCAGIAATGGALLVNSIRYGDKPDLTISTFVLVFFGLAAITLPLIAAVQASRAGPKHTD